MLLAAVILIGALLAFGPVLGALHPVLTEAGRLDGATLVVAIFTGLNFWRYRVGRAALITLTAEAGAVQQRGIA